MNEINFNINTNTNNSSDNFTNVKYNKDIKSKIYQINPIIQNNINNINQDEFTSVKISEIKKESKDKETKQQTTKNVKIGISLASLLAIPLFTFSILSMFRTGKVQSEINSKTSKSNLNILKNKMELLTKSDKIKAYILKINSKINDKMKKFFTKIEPITCNPVAIRDSACDIMLKKLKMSKYTDQLRNIFTSITIKACDNLYKKSDDKFYEGFIELENILEKSVKAGKVSDLESTELLAKLNKLKNNYNINFNKIARNDRLKHFNSRISDLDDKVSDYIFKDGGVFLKGNKGKKNSLNEYISFKLSKNERLEVKKQIESGYEQISTLLDLCKNDFKKFTDNKEFKKLESKLNNAQKRLNEAASTESTIMLDKIIEIKVGSATTDVISFLLPAGYLVYSLTQADNKEERMSKFLTSGIPILGGLGVTLYSTAKMDSAMKSLFIGSIAGLGLEYLANVIDRKYKDFRQENILKNEALDYYLNNKK